MVVARFNRRSYRRAISPEQCLDIRREYKRRYTRENTIKGLAARFEVSTGSIRKIIYSATCTARAGLTYDECFAIRCLYAARREKRVTMAELAERYQCGVRAVWKAVNNRYAADGKNP